MTIVGFDINPVNISGYRAPAVDPVEGEPGPHAGKYVRNVRCDVEPGQLVDGQYQRIEGAEMALLELRNFPVHHSDDLVFEPGPAGEPPSLAEVAAAVDAWLVSVGEQIAPWIGRTVE